MITMPLSGPQRLFDHSVYTYFSFSTAETSRVSCFSRCRRWRFCSSDTLRFCNVFIVILGTLYTYEGTRFFRNVGIRLDQWQSVIHQKKRMLSF